MDPSKSVERRADLTDTTTFDVPIIDLSQSRINLPFSNDILASNITGYSFIDTPPTGKFEFDTIKN
jgi:hypothetical protein